MANNRQQLPEINYAALDSGTVKKRGGKAAFILLLLLVAGALFFFRERISWLASELTSEPAKVTQNPSDTGNSRPQAPQTKPKPKKLAEAELPSTANSETNELAAQPVISVEVISPGGRRQTIHPRDAAVNLHLGGSTKATPAQTPLVAEAATAAKAAEPERVVTDTPPEVVYRPSEPVYPRLAEQMKIEGSVTLHLNIDQNGNIVETQVLSGPEILANAAREAIRRWRFRPRYKNGVPIGTEARVIVNFTISTR